jgi:hypothetical protein
MPHHARQLLDVVRKPLFALCCFLIRSHDTLPNNSNFTG